MKRNYRPWLRATLIILGVIIFVSGVTFAALQSQQDILTGNTIETATANLQLSIDGTSYGNSRTGFDFNNLIPGGPAVPTAGYSFYLKNAGGTLLNLNLAVVSSPTNLNSVDLAKVNVLLTTVGSGTPAQSFSLQSLISANGMPVSGSLASGATQQYKLQISMAGDALTGSSASLGNIDFAISGVALGN